MGNAYGIYNDKCLDYPLEHIQLCPVYAEHLENEKVLNYLGRIFEKFIFQNFNLTDVQDHDRISWYQLMGQLVKKGGDSMRTVDPFKEGIFMTGKVEKLIGQMEDEFAILCNHQISVPIQELRNYCETVVEPLYASFLESLNNLKTNEKNRQNYSIEDQRNILRNLHIQLHKSSIYVYEAMVNLKLKLPAMIEHQLQLNTYSLVYLEYLLGLFKGNKTVKKQHLSLQKFKEGARINVQDYRSRFKYPALENINEPRVTTQKGNKKDNLARYDKKTQLDDNDIFFTSQVLKTEGSWKLQRCCKHYSIKTKSKKVERHNLDR